MADRLMLELHQVCAGYGEIQVLWGVDIAVRSGEITALVGSNGAGKTTLLRVMAGIYEPVNGTVGVS